MTLENYWKKMKNFNGLLLPAALVAMLCACEKPMMQEETTAEIIGEKTLSFEPCAILWNHAPAEESKSSLCTDASLTLSDINAFVFDANGKAYRGRCAYFEDQGSFELRLGKLKSYNVLVVANLGEDRTGEIDLYEDMDDFCENFRIDCPAPSGDAISIPMAGLVQVSFMQTRRVIVNLVRLYSRWKVSVDRSKLQYSKIGVQSIKVMNSPRWIYPFRDGGSATDCSGMSYGGEGGDFADADDLSLLSAGGSIYLYLPENMQGETFSEDEQYRYTYLEMEASFDNPQELYSSVTYRTYLGESITDDYNVRRGKAYALTLQPSSDELHTEPWRIETDGPDETFDYAVDNDWIGIIHGYSSFNEFRFTSERKGFLEQLQLGELDVEDDEIDYHWGTVGTAPEGGYQRTLSFSTHASVSGCATINADNFRSTYTPLKSTFDISYKGIKLHKTVTVYTHTQKIPIVFRDNYIHTSYYGDYGECLQLCTIAHAPEFEYDFSVSGRMGRSILVFTYNGIGVRDGVEREMISSWMPIDYSCCRTCRFNGNYYGAGDQIFNDEAFSTGFDFRSIENAAIEGSKTGYHGAAWSVWELDVTLDTYALTSGCFYLANSLGDAVTNEYSTSYNIGWKSTDYLGGDHGTLYFHQPVYVSNLPLRDTGDEGYYHRVFEMFSYLVYEGDILSFNGKTILPCRDCWADVVSGL